MVEVELRELLLEEMGYDMDEIYRISPVAHLLFGDMGRGGSDEVSEVQLRVEPREESDTL